VGCGGAGKAAAYAACELGNQVVILNRTYEKAEAFVEKLLEYNPLYNVRAANLKDFGKWFRKAGAVIYTLPEPIDAITELRKEEIKGGLFWNRPKVILEAAYLSPAFSPEVTDRLKDLNEKITYVSGKEWLLHQAVEAFGIFTGREPNIPEMIKVL
jgi:shikimate 5-dehydrogenase